MKEYVIAVDGYGMYEEFTIKAKDLPTAKKKAKKLAIAEFTKTLKAFKV